MPRDFKVHLSWFTWRTFGNVLVNKIACTQCFTAINFHVSHLIYLIDEIFPVINQVSLQVSKAAVLHDDQKFTWKLDNEKVL